MKKLLSMILLSSSALAAEKLAPIVVPADVAQFNEVVEGRLPYFQKSEMTPIWKVEKLPHESLLRVSNFELSSQIEEKFSSKTILSGKVSIASFFFASCPGYCPMMTKNIKKSYEALQASRAPKNSVLFLSFSVTPDADTREVLKAHAEKYKITGSDWHFLTGNRELIYKLARQDFQSDLDIDLNKKEDQFVHSLRVYLLDQDRFVRGIYNANDPVNMGMLVRDATTLTRKNQRLVNAR